MRSGQGKGARPPLRLCLRPVTGLKKKLLHNIPSPPFPRPVIKRETKVHGFINFSLQVNYLSQVQILSSTLQYLID